jgi:formate hydrogenlyase transcriptional activator
MTTSTPLITTRDWLLAYGPGELDLLSRTIAFNPSLPPDSIYSAQSEQASCLLDSDGYIAAWSPGANALYGYSDIEAVDRHASFLYADLYAANAEGDELAGRARVDKELSRAAKGSVSIERLHQKKDGSSFWANLIAVSLVDDDQYLQGFAMAVRDFSKFREIEEKVRHSRTFRKSTPEETYVASIVSGEFEKVTSANDAFLGLVGYTQDDLSAGSIEWTALTPKEFVAQDQFAHEEELKFGACTPYEKELIRKDGTRIPVLIATAVVKLCPFRWISFIQDFRNTNLSEPASSESKNDFEEMVGNSGALKRVLRQIEVVAPTDATVLVLGETGTGKELIARAIHRMSPRRKFPCISLNCAAIPTGLLESELFGYERGAFTGALSQKIGRFEMAHRGTLFLDEVGDIPVDLQPKLLRALQEKSFERLGGTKTIPIDVRLVAATNRNLTQMMGDKLFRSDLYYRLRVFPITAPPLRDRRDDIPLLVRHFTKKYSLLMNRRIDTIPPQTMRALVAWNWPGNIRELENFIERAVILTSGSTLRAPLSEIQTSALPADSALTLEQVEREHILRIFRESGGVVTAAATRLGLQRTTLNAMMRKLGISRRDL